MNGLRKSFQLLLFLSILFAGFSCANRGVGPQGGPKDETPPNPVKSNPANGATNFTGKKIEIEFDENISLKDIAANVILSPPQKSNPEIRSYGKKLTVNLNDTLIQDATYTIDFGNAIVDNNEGNILKDYVFSFATGNEIDSLKISGVLINAEDLNPLESVYIGIHSNLSDSSFFKNPFDRITRSGDNGRFTVHNVKKDRFKVFALDDINRDHIFQPGEGAAFIDKIFETDVITELTTDTIWADSLTVDSIHQTRINRFTPDSVVLMFSRKESKRQYLAKTERTAPHLLSLYFNTENEVMPTIKAIDLPWDDMQLLQHNATNDSLTYWLTDSLLIKKDTITLEINYLKSDSLMELVPQTDSVRFMMRRSTARQPQVSPKKENKIEFLKITSNASSRFDSYKDFFIEFNAPVLEIDSGAVQLSRQVDSIYHNLPVTVIKADSIGLKYQVLHKWEPEESYQLTIDSAAVADVYGKHNNKMSSDIKVRSLEEYATLIITFSDFEAGTVIQVLDRSDKPIRSVPATDNPVTIPFLEAGEYYLRMFIDRNGNTVWDPGDPVTGLQPEEVFYFSKKLNLIKNWEFEENWDHRSTPLLQQKPEEIRKSAPLKK